VRHTAPMVYCPSVYSLDRGATVVDYSGDLLDGALVLLIDVAPALCCAAVAECLRSIA